MGRRIVRLRQFMADYPAGSGTAHRTRSASARQCGACYATRRSACCNTGRRCGATADYTARGHYQYCCSNRYAYRLRVQP